MKSDFSVKRKIGTETPANSFAFDDAVLDLVLQVSRVSRDVLEARSVI